MTHATVNVGGYSIPLIGIPEDATTQECDKCHDVFPLQSVTLNGKQFLCTKCAKQFPTGRVQYASTENDTTRTMIRPKQANPGTTMR